MDRLRDADDGCPWDLEQSLASLKPFLIEESYETLDAIDDLGAAANALPGERPEVDRAAVEAHRDELGDVLLQVVFQARIAKEMGWYTADDVAVAISDKMVRRHPHVFAEPLTGADEVTTAGQVVDQWEQIKVTERAGKVARKSVLDGVPRGMPALLRGHKIGKKAAKIGFDWPDAATALDKVEEEIAELREVLHGDDVERIEEELGDLLFAMTSVARKSGVDPEQAMHRALAKFQRRFAYVEDQLQAHGDSSARPTAPLEQLERWWQQAKLST